MTESTDGEHGFVLRGGTLIDGSGAPPTRADVVVEGARIVDLVPPSEPVEGLSNLDVSGLVVAPGFVDLHTHADFSLPTHPSASSMVRQGVTTLVTGNCGYSPFPLGPGERAGLLAPYTSFFGRSLSWEWTDQRGYLAQLEAVRPAVNVATLVGHGSLRIAVMGFDAREPTVGELEGLESLTDEAMRHGAFGLSSGLIYAPGTYAPPYELARLAAVVAGHDGLYASHMRQEGEAVLASIREILDVGHASGVRTQISHHKVLGRRNWGLTKHTLALVDEHVESGLDLALDQYPYPASATSLRSLLPTWVLESGPSALPARLADPDVRARLRNEIVHGPGDGTPHRDFEPDTLTLSSAEVDDVQGLVGRTVQAIAAERAVDPVDAMLDLLAVDPAIEVVIRAIGEEDIERIMVHPRVAVASDGWTMHPDEGGQPHPRSYGTFARVLGTYVRERGVLDLAEAVRKMSSLPASRIGLSDRGTVRSGAWADLVVLDPARIADRATFLRPHAFAEGVRHVFVNGSAAVLDGVETGRGSGAVLRSTDRR